MEPAPSTETNESRPAEEAPARLGRGQERSARDMTLSLAVLLVPIALLLIFYRVVLSGDAPVTVDATPAIQEAQQAAAFPVAVPRGLGDDWHTASATFQRQSDGATLRIGYVDPGKDPVQLVESSVPPATLLPGELGSGGKALDVFRTPAGVWRVYDGRQGEKALVLAEPTRTIVVVGKAELSQLEALASTLS
ncbi:DUF4245 domain-containing protein [Actinoplanes sp. KI2]|uniref:DUF4245 domain-containing protein n=1 Tax=Actinoplanes sp. KI2 TaxID=2983315 RepID=UPI0021D5F78A|nr:DUF4245 domain-containing protein [Actinoplanes sp. KI2]MCU7726682.1 DUF4245 domain-containing protein [Actinoplanes sp. KI2]